MNLSAALQLALRALWRNKTRALLTTGFLHDGPAAVRYPRGPVHGDDRDVTGLIADGAGAQVLNNRDDVSRNVTVMAKSARRLVAVEPGKAISDFCPNGCVIRVDDDETRDFLIEGNERLSIENGLVYFDGEIASKDGAAGETPAGDAGDGGDT